MCGWLQKSSIILFITITLICLVTCQSPNSVDNVPADMSPEATDVLDSVDEIPSATDSSDQEEILPDTDIAPVPTFEVSGTGAVIGQVVFPDNSPGYHSVIFIFKPNSVGSLASVYVDNNGYYMFDNLFPGSYEIYAGNDPQSYDPALSCYVGDPNAMITVFKNTVTNVPTFTLLRKISISLEDPHNNWQTVSISGTRNAFESMINGDRPVFNWNTIPNTNYYVVAVWSTEFNAGERKGYNKQQTVTANSIMWADNLSLSPYKEYVVEIVAYTEDDQSLARGYWRFFIDSPPDGWQPVE